MSKNIRYNNKDDFYFKIAIILLIILAISNAFSFYRSYSQNNANNICINNNYDYAIRTSTGFFCIDIIKYVPIKELENKVDSKSMENCSTKDIPCYWVYSSYTKRWSQIIFVEGKVYVNMERCKYVNLGNMTNEDILCHYIESIVFEEEKQDE